MKCPGLLNAFVLLFVLGSAIPAFAGITSARI